MAVGLIYVSSWKNGGFGYSGEDVGFVAQLRAKDYTPKPFPVLEGLDLEQLVDMLAAPSAVHRLHAQREILRRGSTVESVDKLVGLSRKF